MRIVFCIFVKTLNVVLMLIALALPFSIFIPKWNWNFIWVFALLSLISYSLINILYKIILDTNNSADRKKFFSINRRFTGKMNGSFGDNGLDAIVLLEPTNQEIRITKQRVRKKKLKKLKSIK